MPQLNNQAATKWVEVKPKESEPMPAKSANTIYGLNLTIGNGYPEESLIALLKEVCAA